MEGNADGGRLEVPGVGHLRNVVDNLDTMLTFYDDNQGKDKVGLHGPWANLLGMSQLKKMRGNARLRNSDSRACEDCYDGRTVIAPNLGLVSVGNIAVVLRSYIDLYNLQADGAPHSSLLSRSQLKLV